MSGSTKYFAARFVIYVWGAKRKRIPLVKRLGKFIRSNAIGP
jgi:hypothetical protein